MTAADPWAPPAPYADVSWAAPAPAPAATPGPDPRQDLRGELRAGAITALMVTVLGGPLGLLWAAVRPALDPGAAALQESVFRVQLTADLRLLLLGLVTGVMTGLLAWLLGRARATGVVVGLAVGGVLAMLLAAQVGRLAAHPDRLESQVAQAFRDRHYVDFAQVAEPGRGNFLDNVRFTNRARTVALGLPLAACGVYSLLVWRRDRSLGAG